MTNNKEILPDLKSLARPEILSLQPYESKFYPGVVKMDANENPYPWPKGMREALLQEEIPFNRYPDAQAKELKKALSGYTGINEEGILVGNGSDEIIQLILSTFGGEGKAVVVHPPTFGMYQAAARVAGMNVFNVPLLDGINLNIEDMINTALKPDVSVIILCSPNNPTGNLFDSQQLLRLVKETGKIVVMDEAYAEFSGQTLIDEIRNYSNLLVMRTFSKAFGLAGLRLGYLLGQSDTINLINRIRQPFNVNLFSQRAGVLALNYLDEYKKQIELIKADVDKIYSALAAIPKIKVYPTQANFILFKPDNPDHWFEALFKEGFLVRHMGELPVLGKCLRVSTGLPEENNRFIKVIQEI